ncbi:MAG: hypothetical protein ABI151_05255 [Chitinophagaceae bacterium]
MEDKLSGKEKAEKNPNEDSVVTDNTTETNIVHDNMKGTKIDGDPSNPDDQPAGDNVLVTNESQKGKAVDADPELEQGVE